MLAKFKVVISGRYTADTRRLTEEINAAFKKIQERQRLGYIRDGVLEDKFSSDFEESTFRPWELTRAHFGSGGSRNGLKYHYVHIFYWHFDAIFMTPIYCHQFASPNYCHQNLLIQEKYIVR